MWWASCQELRSAHFSAEQRALEDTPTRGKTRLHAIYPYHHLYGRYGVAVSRLLLSRDKTHPHGLVPSIIYTSIKGVGMLSAISSVA